MFDAFQPATLPFTVWYIEHHWTIMITMIMFWIHVSCLFLLIILPLILRNSSLTAKTRVGHSIPIVCSEIHRVDMYKINPEHRMWQWSREVALYIVLHFPLSCCLLHASPAPQRGIIVPFATSQVIGITYVYSTHDIITTMYLYV